MPVSLSRREKAVVDLLLQGKSNKQIALGLGISERTVEFHLKNVYGKLRVTSRVELILKLGKTTGDDSADLVESTVETHGEEIHNGNQPARTRAAHTWRNTFSLIRKEVAMTIRISFEELENYLRSHPIFFSLLLFLAVSLTTRYVIIDTGLYFWASYILLGVLLGAGSIYFGWSWKKVKAGKFHTRISPLIVIAVTALLPLLAAGLDQILLNTIFKTMGETSITIGSDIYTKAAWRVTSEGISYLYRERHTWSDDFWLYDVHAYMLFLFLFSLVAGKRFKRNDLATV